MAKAQSSTFTARFPDGTEMAVTQAGPHSGVIYTYLAGSSSPLPLAFNGASTGTVVQPADAATFHQRHGVEALQVVMQGIFRSRLDWNQLQTLSLARLEGLHAELMQEAATS